jgi:hypothetical protein
MANSEHIKAVQTDYQQARAAGKEQLRMYFLAKLQHLKDDYVDTLPNVKVEHNDQIYYKYKARANYIAVVMSTLELGVKDGIITNPAAVAAVNAFTKRDWNCRRNEPTSQEEIDFINQTLATVLSSLATKE